MIERGVELGPGSLRVGRFIGRLGVVTMPVVERGLELADLPTLALSIEMRDAIDGEPRRFVFISVVVADGERCSLRKREPQTVDVGQSACV